MAVCLLSTGLGQCLGDISVKRRQHTLQFGQILDLLFALRALLGRLLLGDVDVCLARRAHECGFCRQVSVQGPVTAASLAITVEKVLDLEIVLTISLKFRGDTHNIRVCENCRLTGNLFTLGLTWK